MVKSSKPSERIALATWRSIKSTFNPITTWFTTIPMDAFNEMNDHDKEKIRTRFSELRDRTCHYQYDMRLGGLVLASDEDLLRFRNTAPKEGSRPTTRLVLPHLPGLMGLERGLDPTPCSRAHASESSGQYKFKKAESETTATRRKQTPNGWVLFHSDHQQWARDLHPQASLAELTKIISDLYWSKSDDEVQPWFDRAGKISGKPPGKRQTPRGRVKSARSVEESEGDDHDHKMTDCPTDPEPASPTVATPGLIPISFLLE